MTQVSRRKVHQDIEKKMYETLWQAISSLKSANDIQIFLDDLLSPIEKLMVAKRLAIASLLLRKYDYQTIMDLLKVSSATVSKVSLVLNSKNGYKITINKIAHAQATREFWQDIENLIFRMSAPGKVFLPEGVVKRKLGHKHKTLL